MYKHFYLRETLCPLQSLLPLVQAQQLRRADTPYIL